MFIMEVPNDSKWAVNCFFIIFCGQEEANQTGTSGLLGVLLPELLLFLACMRLTGRQSVLNGATPDRDSLLSSTVSCGTHCSSASRKLFLLLFLSGGKKKKSRETCELENFPVTQPSVQAQQQGVWVFCPAEHPVHSSCWFMTFLALGSILLLPTCIARVWFLCFLCSWLSLSPWDFLTSAAPQSLEWRTHRITRLERT